MQTPRPNIFALSLLAHLIAAELYVRPIHKDVALDFLPVAERIQVRCFGYCCLICSDVETISDGEKRIAAHSWLVMHAKPSGNLAKMARRT